MVKKHSSGQRFVQPELARQVLDRQIVVGQRHRASDVDVPDAWVPRAVVADDVHVAAAVCQRPQV